MTDDTMGSDDAAGAESGDDGATTKTPLSARVLVVVATILGIVAVFTVGARTQMLDTDEWVNLSSELLDEPSVQESLAVYLVDTVYTEIEVDTELAELLPEDLEGLASPIAGALRGPLTDGIKDLLDSDAFQQLWAEANRRTHQTMVNILRDETTEGISTAEGTVTLELQGLVASVAETLGLPDDAIDRLPEDAGRIVIFESDELDTVQSLVKILDFLAWFIFALVVALYALAVYLARDRWLAALRTVGWSLLGIGIIVLAARALAVRALVNAIVEEPAGRANAETVADIGTALLRQMGWSAAIYGVLIVLFTSLMGPHRWATSIRRAIAPALNAGTGAVVAGTAVVLLLLFWWRPGRAFEGWVTALVLIGLVIGAVVALRRQTQREFADVAWDAT